MIQEAGILVALNKANEALCRESIRSIEIDGACIKFNFQHGESQYFNLSGEFERVHASIASSSEAAAKSEKSINELISKVDDSSRKLIDEAKTDAQIAYGLLKDDLDSLAKEAQTAIDSLQEQTLTALSGKAEQGHTHEEYALKSDIPVIPSMDEFVVDAEIEESNLYIIYKDGTKKRIGKVGGETTIINSGGGSFAPLEHIKSIIAGEGISIDNSNPFRPVISATAGQSLQQVFIDALPDIDYPAISFSGVTIDGEEVFEMWVNDV